MFEQSTLKSGSPNWLMAEDGAVVAGAELVGAKVGKGVVGAMVRPRATRQLLVLSQQQMRRALASTPGVSQNVG